MTRRQTISLLAVVLFVVAAVTTQQVIVRSGPDGPGSPRAGVGTDGSGSAEAKPDPAASFTSADIGMNADLADLDAIANYLPGESPIIRVTLDWWRVEQCRGCELQWDAVDRLVEEVRARDMRVMLLVAYAPPWANSTPGGPEHADMTTWFPTDNTDWISIIDRMVRHFGDDVQAYEIWNEPNNLFFGRYDGDRKARYWEMVRLAHQHIHAACDSCVVVAGASANHLAQGQEDDPGSWLEWAYKHGYGSFFDAVAHHPYIPPNGAAEPHCDRPAKNNFGPPGEDPPCGELARLHSVMVKYGDTEKKIWGTEWGYPISAPGDRSQAEIRDNLVESVRMWRSLTYTGPLFLYSFRDSCENSKDLACSFGVVNRQFTPKEPVFSALAAALRYVRAECVGHPGPPPPQAPQPRMPAGQCWKLEWGRSLTSANGLLRLQLQADGNLVLYMNDHALWSSGTNDAVRLVNEIDGRLVLYRADGTPTWFVGTAGSGPSTLHLQDDGNLVLYRNSDVTTSFSSNTLRNHTLIRNETGGVAVLVGGAAVWFNSPEELVRSGYADTPPVPVPDSWANVRRSSPEDGTLIRNESGRLALIAGGAAIWFTDREEAARYGYDDASSIPVPDRWSNTLSSIPRDGTVIRTQNGAASVIAGGAAMTFISPSDIYEAGYQSTGVVVPDRWRDSLRGVPQDGTLVRTGTSPQVWRVNGGVRTAVTPTSSETSTVIGEPAMSGIPLG